MNDNISIKGDNNKVNENSFQTTQSRWRSKVLWTTIITDILGLLGLLGFYDFTGITQDKLSAICGVIMSIITTVGIINNPSDKNNI
jgi:uncharacterized membrane protein